MYRSATIHNDSEDRQTDVHLIPRMPFPICGPLEPSLYL